MQKIKISQDDIKKEILKIYTKIDEICEKLGLEHWVMYGTLIGAVRHHGFIPWDDDFDIAMKREDYDKFIEYCLENDIGPYYLDNYEISDNYPYYISKICSSDVILKFNHTSYTSGIFIDIYPLDGMGNDKEYWKKNKKKIEKLNRRLSRYNIILAGNNVIANFYRKYIASIYQLKGRTRVLNKIDAISRKFSFEESRYVGVPAWVTISLAYEKEWFEEFIKVPFEGIEVSIPKQYDKILKIQYGNYMQLPPVEKQIGHHEYIAYKK